VEAHLDGEPTGPPGNARQPGGQVRPDLLATLLTHTALFAK